ncbi:MAG: S-layer homology domain-containing protein [Candidatus Margulisiibacteriota bacterium]|jgi:hypothetical protein
MKLYFDFNRVIWLGRHVARKLYYLKTAKNGLPILLLSIFFFLNLNIVYAESVVPSANSIELFTGQVKTTVFYAKIKKSIFSFLFNKSLKIKFINFIEKLPNKDTNNIGAYSPVSNIIVNKSDVIFKGFNKYLMPTFVNGTLVKLREDGRFFYDYKNKKIKNIIVVSFTTPEYKVISLVKKIIYLKPAPKDVRLYKKNRNFIIYYINSDYVNPSQNIISLSQIVTRADLAYFIYKLKVIEQNKPIKASLFIDVPADYWAAPAIKYALEKNIMLEYPDGKFYPEKPVTEIEYIISLVRAYNFQDLDFNLKLPYSNIDPDHWTTKYIKIAYKKGFIAKRETLDIYFPLKMGDFISQIGLIDKVKSNVQSVKNFQDFKLGSKEKDEIMRQVKEQLKQYQAALLEKQKIELYTPFDNALFLEPQVVFQGKITPVYDFKINKQMVKPDMEGNFLTTFNVTNKITLFRINVFNETHVFKIYFLPRYIDLKGHWIEQTAAKLRSLKLLGNEQLFNPEKLIRRYELANYIKTMFSLKEDTKRQVHFSDLSAKNANFLDLKILAEKRILKTDKEDNIYPYKEVTNLEAIVAITRLLNASEKGPLPYLRFRNIPKKHWAYKTLQLAVKEKLITNRRFLDVKKKITKAELIALLAKTPYVKEKLTTVFQKN